MKTFVGVLVIVLASVEAHQLQSQEDHLQDHPEASFGAISGKVLYQNGKPVSGARVCPIALDRPNPSIMPQSFTNEKGEFLVAGLRVGHYEVPAAKEDEGYPEMGPIFYGIDELAPREEVSAGKVTVGVVVRLGAKASRLVGRIENASTHQEVQAGIGFYKAEGPIHPANAMDGLYLTRTSGYRSGESESGRVGTLGRGEFDILVPANKPFLLEVGAPGYEPWYYGTDGTKQNAAPIKVSEGATKKLLILLRPLKKAAH